MTSNLSTYIRTIILAAMSLLCTGMASAKTYIVCVGIDDYPGEVNDLFLCVKDARTMQWLFDKNGDCETVLITDHDATVANIKTAMTQLYGKAKKSDTVIFFFSGHGNNGSIVCRDQEMTYDDICHKFDASKAKKRFAFINACFSGSMRKHYDVGLINKKQVMFFLSSRAGETTLQQPTMHNSIFVAYLQQGLRGSADANRDRTITAHELFEYVSNNVKAASNYKQHPVMWGKFDDNMTVLKW